MATYKVIQDVEAEDKLVGPLTLRQFIYAGIGAISGYLGFLMTTKGAGFMLVVFLPVTLVSFFFAFPWGRDQPTEIWALAKIRFMIKPRKRIWDQSGAKDLVTVAAPKVIARHLTNGLRQDEVQSRLTALANTIDSRGWAVKNVNVNLATPANLPEMNISDRLVEASSFPQSVSDFDVNASDDILDETANTTAHNVDTMLRASETSHRQKLMQQMQSSAPAKDTAQNRQFDPATPPADYWFMHQPQAVAGKATFTDAPVVVPGSTQQPALAPQAIEPTPDEQALVEHFKRENQSISAAYGRMKTVHTPKELAEIARAEAAALAESQVKAAAEAKPTVTPDEQAAIINYAHNDDWSVATLARQVNKGVTQRDDGSVEIQLH